MIFSIVFSDTLETEDFPGVHTEQKCKSEGFSYKSYIDILTYFTV